jgi:hypothetical protein
MPGIQGVQETDRQTDRQTDSRKEKECDEMRGQNVAWRVSCTFETKLMEHALCSKVSLRETYHI